MGRKGDTQARARPLNAIDSRLFGRFLSGRLRLSVARLRRDRREFIRGGLSILLLVVIKRLLVNLVEVEAH